MGKSKTVKDGQLLNNEQLLHDARPPPYLGASLCQLDPRLPFAVFSLSLLALATFARIGINTLGLPQQQAGPQSWLRHRCWFGLRLGSLLRRHVPDGADHTGNQPTQQHFRHQDLVSLTKASTSIATNCAGVSIGILR